MIFLISLMEAEHIRRIDCFDGKAAYLLLILLLQLVINKWRAER